MIIRISYHMQHPSQMRWFLSSSLSPNHFRDICIFGLSPILIVLSARVARLLRQIRDQKSVIAHLRLQLTKSQRDLQSAMDYIARFERSTWVISACDPIPSSIDSSKGISPVFLVRPIQTQIICEVMNTFGASGPKLRRYSPLFYSAMCFTIQ
jgi:hypothetical protein